MALTYHMFAPAWTAHRFRKRVAAELGALVQGEVRGRWEELETGQRTPFQRFFNTEFDLTHRLEAEARLTRDRILVAELYLNARQHVPGALDVRVSQGWPLGGPWTYWAEDGRCDGNPRLTETLAGEGPLRQLCKRAVRPWWKGGSIQVHRPDARLEINPSPDGGSVLLLASMPHERFLGLSTRLELPSLVRILDVLEQAS